VTLADLRHAWEHGLPRALGWETVAAEPSGPGDPDELAAG